MDFGVEWTLVGHSERRQFYGETDEVVAKKTKYALEKGLKVILCIGEKDDERKAGQTVAVLRTQLDACKAAIPDWSRVVIAYEPVWAIGTGNTATPEIAQEAHKDVRQWVRENVSQDVAKAVRIIYGGSASDANCGDLIKQVDIDGFLVGGASLKPAFGTICNVVGSH